MDVFKARWIDLLLLAPIVALGIAQVFTSVEFAANLPQDAADFAIPAVTLLERGRMVVPAFGRDFAMGHPVGLPILLAPLYFISGHFIGNGIYLILLFAIGSIILVYWIGRELCGRICGSVASLFLASHNGFQQYSQKIMSEVPSIFLMTAIFAVTLYLAKEQRRSRTWLFLGALLGLALVVRYDNVLVIVPLIVLCAAGLLRFRPRDAILLLLGAAPWLGIQAAYNQHFYGSVRRTGYEYEGDTTTGHCPTFSWRHALARTYLECRDVPLWLEDSVDGNLSLYAKALLDEADNTLCFSNDPRWKDKPQRTYQALIIARTILGALGLVACAFWRRRNVMARAMLLWTGSLSLSMLVFYSLYFWQEERFLLRLAPFFCLLNGVGVFAIIHYLGKLRPRVRTIGAFGVLIETAALIVLLLVFSDRSLIIDSNDNVSLYPLMRATDSLVEKDAVIITNFDPIRTDAHLIRGTARTAIQLSDDDDYHYVPEIGGPTLSMSPFKAVDRPDIILQFLHDGRPVYLLWKYIAFSQPMPELQTLSKDLAFQPIASAALPGRQPQPYLFRVRAAATHSLSSHAVAD